MLSGPIGPPWWTSKRITLLDASGNDVMLDLNAGKHFAFPQFLDHSHEIGPRSLLAAGAGQNGYIDWLMTWRRRNIVYVDEERATVAPPGMYD